MVSRVSRGCARTVPTLLATADRGGGFLSNGVFSVVKRGLFLLPRQFRAAFMRLSGLGNTCGVAGGIPDVTKLALRADFASFLLFVVSVSVSIL